VEESVTVGRGWWKVGVVEVEVEVEGGGTSGK